MDERRLNFITSYMNKIFLYEIRADVGYMQRLVVL
jgi:hypothetical protein